MGKHAFAAMLVFIFGALPCILFGYLIAIKQWRNLIAGWDESKVADPEAYARIIGGSALGMGIGFAAISILVWTQLYSSDIIVGSIFVLSFLAILCLVYANIKYDKRTKPEDYTMHTADKDKAIAFILQQNDPVPSSLAKYINGDFSCEQTIEALKLYQREDGGWTRTDKDFQGDLSIITATFVALQWLNWIGDRDSAVLMNTLDYLQKAQREDGSWDEPDEIVDFNPPFWMLPGRYGNQLWLTSAICCKLKELDKEQHVDFPKALEFLRQGWDGEQFPDYLHTHWMTMPLLHLHGSSDEADKQIIKGCKQRLYDALKKEKTDPGDMISIAYGSYLAGDIAQDLLELALDKIKGYQQDDGGWITNHGEEHRTSFTIEALFLFKKIGQI